MFGTTLRLLGEFFLPDDYKPDLNYFLEEFREYMRQVRPVPVLHKHKKRAFYFKDLHNCTHVFLRNMAKKALERPYTGPHKILQRVSEHVFNIEINGNSKSVSVDLLRPAYFVSDDLINFPATGENITAQKTDPPTLKIYSRKKITFPSTDK